MSFTFDPSFMVSSFITEGINVVLVIAAIMMADMLISHGIELKRVVILSVVAYFVGPIVSYYTSLFLPFYIPYLIPLLFWIIAAEIILPDYDMKNKAIIAAIGYVLFVLITYIGLSSILISMLHI